MKTFKLLKLEITDFKGIENLIINPNGENLEIRGANKTLKTTINDAYLWLISGKDSLGHTDGKGGFDVLPQDEKGNVLEGKEACVLASFVDQDGVETSLSRTYSETWSRTRGTDIVKMTGNKSGFAIGSREVKKSEFISFLGSIAPINIMSLITSISAFTENENKTNGWKENRALLIDMVGGTKSDEELLQSDEKFNIISTDLNECFSIDSLVSDLKASKNKTKKKVDEDEIKIEQQKKNTPKPLDFNEIEKQIGIKEAAIRQAEIFISDKSELFTDYVGKKYTQNVKIEEVKNEIRKIEGEINEANEKAETDFLTLKNSLTSKIKINVNNLIDFKNEKLSLSEKIKALNIKVQEMRSEYGIEAAKTVVFDEEESICPVCEQQLPENQLTEKTATLIANFNTEKVSKLEGIKKKGAELNAIILQKENEIKEIDNAVKLIDIESIKKQLDGLIEPKKEMFEENSFWDEKNLHLTVLENELSLISPPEKENTDEIKEILIELREKKDALTQELNVRAQITESERKVSLLNDNRNAMIKDLVLIEQKLILIEEFIQLKIGAVEPKINSLFNTVKFKLFERNITGGIEEKCEAMIDGQVFNTNVNTAARVNGGLEIVNKLCEHYGVSMPLFLDNRESTTDLIQSNSQIVSLFVDPGCKTLKIG